jgi:ribosomal protein S18 acetylase RimI-like enzyme
VAVFRIEVAGLSDLPGAYRTCLLTADSGDDASLMHDDPDLFGHVYAGPYITRGIGTQLVVNDEYGTAGYLLSADDTIDFEAWAETVWWPPLRERYPIPEGDSRDARLIGMIHAPPRSPEHIVREYPAHLHIDLQARTRGSGLGRVLIERLLTELRDRHVAGVHLGVSLENANAIGFYKHLGFREVGRQPGSVLMAQHLR